MWASHYFAKETELPGGNHVDDTWDVINHLANFVVTDAIFLDSHNGDVEYPPDALMKENLKLLKKVLLK
jgi:hypothetical protein